MKKNDKRRKRSKAGQGEKFRTKKGVRGSGTRVRRKGGYRTRKWVQEGGEKRYSLSTVKYTYKYK